METTTAGRPPLRPDPVQETIQGPTVEATSPGEAVRPPEDDGAILRVALLHSRIITALPTTTADNIRDIAPLFVTSDVILLIDGPHETAPSTIQVMTPTIRVLQEVGLQHSTVGFRERGIVMVVAAQAKELTGKH